MLRDDGLSRGHHGIVEHPVEQPDLARGIAAGRDELRSDMLDDDARFHDRLAVIDEKRKLANRPMSGKLGLDLGLFDVAELERRAGFVKRDEGLPGVG